jgi:hypothetical protein
MSYAKVAANCLLLVEYEYVLDRDTSNFSLRSCHIVKCNFKVVGNTVGEEQSVGQSGSILQGIMWRTTYQNGGNREQYEAGT